MKKVRKLFPAAVVVGLFCLVVIAGISYESYRAGQTPVAAQSTVKATFSFDRYTGNKPFKLNTLPTTPYGPAWADVVLKPSNMLACKGSAPIALCYYSGPNGVTPCTPDGLGIANCTCYEIPTGQPYMVDINNILNEEAYLKTVKTCGKDGSDCLPTGKAEAPVCDYINKNTLIPGADLISTFSLYLEKQIPIGETNCPTPSAYAGCMTAPCKRTGKKDPKTGLPLVQCGCPLYTGPYQVGTATDQCALDGPYVWSAAYNPAMNPSPTPTPGE
ncbi:MAG TPA: hypothetical protein VGO50_12635 [Pyrinomonadaceae bacterium]|jgi:hypothetical protein|nr:hypothetical protein [Pyrinomonadaceae bacterium]